MIGLKIALHAVALGTALSVVLGGARAVTLVDGSDPPNSNRLMLSCHVSGGGYAIKSTSGQVLENGDGMPFPAGRPVLLEITAQPRRIRVAEGSLPHPACSSGPVLDSVTPLGFNWCRAHYDLEARQTGGFLLRSTSSRLIDTGPHRGDVMEAFFVGDCVSATKPRTSR